MSELFRRRRLDVRCALTWARRSVAVDEGGEASLGVGGGGGGLSPAMVAGALPLCRYESVELMAPATERPTSSHCHG